MAIAKDTNPRKPATSFSGPSLKKVCTNKSRPSSVGIALVEHIGFVGTYRDRQLPNDREGSVVEAWRRIGRLFYAAG